MNANSIAPRENNMNGKFPVIELQLSATSSRTDWTNFNKLE